MLPFRILTMLLLWSANSVLHFNTSIWNPGVCDTTLLSAIAHDAYPLVRKVFYSLVSNKQLIFRQFNLSKNFCLTFILLSAQCLVEYGNISSKRSSSNEQHRGGCYQTITVIFICFTRSDCGVNTSLSLLRHLGSATLLAAEIIFM